MADAERIIFVHIPKTGGSSFVPIALRQFSPAAVANLPGSLAQARAGLAALPDTTRRRLRFLYGHVPFGLHASLPGTSRYLTFLRHPVERMLSVYHFARRRPEWGVHRIIHERQLSLAQFVDSDVAAEFNNGQTRFLAGSDDPVTSRDALERALRHLSAEVALVGVTERFDESLLVCGRLLGWRRLCYRRRNVNRRRPAIDTVPARIVALIERRNELDLELYAAARRRVVDAFAADPTLAEELHRFQAVNRIYHRVGTAAALIPQITRAGLAAARRSMRSRSSRP